MGNVVQEIYMKWQKAESIPPIQIEGEDYVTALELQTKAVVGGTYRIQWYMEVARIGSTNFPRRIRVRFGTTAIGQHTFEEDNDNYMAYSGWHIETLGNRATPTLDIQGSTEAGPPPRRMNIQNARLSIELMETE